jgi:septum formation protein
VINPIIKHFPALSLNLGNENLNLRGEGITQKPLTKRNLNHANGHPERMLRLDVIVPFPVVLASGSPRRRQLLAELIPDFEILVADADEEPILGEDPWQLATRLAELKAKLVHTLRPQSLVIGGDTVVTYDDEGWKLLAKPDDPDHACRMLRALSGRDHKVITGVCVAWPNGVRTFSDTSTVTFRKLNEEEIRAYVAGGEPMDKAGAYAIQGGAAPFVERFEGSLSNIIGLPLEALTENLRGLTPKT